jgi:hypothetical protein
MPMSGQTTGTVPVEGIDPGGTRPAPKGDATHKGTSGLDHARPEVESGDSNTMNEEPEKGPARS